MRRALRRRGALLRWLLAAVLLCLASCVTAVDERDPEGPFIALGTDFEDFREWPRWEIPDIGTSSGHDPGEPRFIYVRDPAPAWGDPFPVGAMIVKTLEVGAPPEWEIHAMAKRGGEYNAEGARGWEWFDLGLSADGRPIILWRGEGTAADPGGYVTVEATGCNACHAVVAGSDYVFTRAVFTPDPEMP